MKKCPWCGREYPDETSVCTLDQSPLEPPTPILAPAVSEPEDSPVAAVEAPEVPSQDAEDTVAPDGFRLLGAFDPFEADRLLKRFLDADIRFQIDRIERRERSGTSSYRNVGYVQIFVQIEDFENAYQILTVDWKV